MLGASGYIQIYDVDNEGRVYNVSQLTPNAILAGLGFAVAKGLGMRDSRYTANMAYIEFENTSAPISNPTPDPMSGREYFENLVSPKDYLRVPLNGLPELATEQDSADYTGIYGTDEGNVVTFRTTTVGTSGMNGVPFDNASNSVVYGLAIVCAPDADDPSKDIVLNRGYYPQQSHRLKQPSGQIGAGWVLKLLPQ